jgi:hypothetical protein
MKLVVRTKEIKGAFKGVSEYPTSLPTSGVGCTHPAVLHQFSLSLHSRLPARLSDVNFFAVRQLSPSHHLIGCLLGGRREIEDQW